MATEKKTTKPVVEKAPKKAVAAKSEKGGLTVSVYSLTGTDAGTLSLPAEIFGGEVNKKLLAQAIRVYQTNQNAHYSNTLTRGEVNFTTRKVYKQKGTGGARHGSKKAPIFVHGGIAHGPKGRKTILELPKKMRSLAVVAALAQKMQDNAIIGLSSLDKASGKTKDMAALFTKLNKKSILIVTEGNLANVHRATRNLAKVEVRSVDQINAYEILARTNLMLTQESVDRIKEKFAAKETVNA